MVLLHLRRGRWFIGARLRFSRTEAGLPRAEPACDRHEISQREAYQRHQRRHQQDVGHQDHPQHASDGHGGEDGHHHAGDDQEAEARLGTGFRQLLCEADRRGTPSQLTFFTTGEYFGA